MEASGRRRYEKVLYSIIRDKYMFLPPLHIQYTKIMFSQGHVFARKSF